MTDQPVDVIVDNDGNYTLKANDESTKERLGWLSPRQLKMALMKSIINTMTPALRLALRGTGRTGEQAISQLVEKVFTRLEDAYEFETTKGVFQEYADSTNFQVLIESIRRLMMYIADEDGYYRVWLGYFFTVIWEEMSVAFQQFNSSNILRRDYPVINDAGYSLDEVIQIPKHRKALFYHYLTNHPRAVQLT